MLYIAHPRKDVGVVRPRGTWLDCDHFHFTIIDTEWAGAKAPTGIADRYDYGRESYRFYDVWMSLYYQSCHDHSRDWIAERIELLAKTCRLLREYDAVHGKPPYDDPEVQRGYADARVECQEAYRV